MKRLFILCSLVVAPNAMAAFDNWHLNGFVSQAALATSDNAFFGHTDDNVSFDYREAALIVTGELVPRLTFSTQLLSRKAGVGDDGSPQVDYAFLTWRFWDSEHFSHSFVLGKLKAPVGFYNETRDSPFTRSSIFLPQSMYMDRMRNTGLVAQELMYVGEFRQENWIFSGKLGAGKVHQDQEEIMDVYLMPDYMRGSFTNDHAWHAQLAADYDGGRVRLAYTSYAAPVKYKGYIGTYSIEADSDVKYQVLSAEYNELNWSLTSEVFLASVKSDQLGYGEDKPQGGYLQAAYRFENNWDCFLRYDYMVLDKADRNGEDYAVNPNKNFSGLPAMVRYAKDSAAGVSYHPNKDWLIRAELHSVQGTAWMTVRDLKKDQPQVEYWNLFALAVSWRF